MKTSNWRGARRLVAVVAAAGAAVLALPTTANASVSTTSDFTVKVTGTVFDVAQVGGRTIVGGTFTAIGSQPREGIGALLPSGYADTKFAPDLSDGAVIYAVAVSEDLSTVYIGGEFTSVNGVPRTNLAALDATTGAVKESWQADATGGAVRTMEVKGDRLYVGGAFTGIDGTTRKRLVALNTFGQVLGTFNPRPSWTVRDIAVAPDGGSVFAVGGFVTIGGADRANGAAQVLTTDGSATAFNPAVGGGLAIAVAVSPDGSRMLFSTENNSIFAYDHAVSNTPVWTNKGGGDTQAIAISPTGEVYIGGHFSQITAVNGKIKRNKLASINLSNGAVTTWAPIHYGDMGPWAIELTDTMVLVGGDSTNIGGRNNGGFGRFSGTP
jgi:hypothetical protein